MGKRKTFFELGIRSQRLTKQNIKAKLVDFSKYLGELGLEVTNMSPISIGPKDPVLEGDTDKDAGIPFRINKNYIKPIDSSIMDTLLVTDSAHMSQRAYHTFRTQLDLKDHLPPLNHLVNMKKCFEDTFELRVNQNGCYLKYPLRKVEFVLRKLMENLSRLTLRDNTLIIKLSGDGKMITKTNLEINNFVFTLINDESVCKTSVGNYILGNY